MPFALPRPVRFSSALLLAASLPLGASAQETLCGNPFKNNFGPHDYRTAEPWVRKIVEDYHFTPRVESLAGGLSSTLGGDLDYTLRAIPNHHRALAAMVRLGQKLKEAQPVGAKFTVECYLQRAIVFRPNDVVVRLIYASFLSTAGRKDEARATIEAALELDPSNGFTQYNAGLLYLEMGDFDAALRQAHRAVEQGFTKPDLRRRLEQAGHWVEAPATASSASSASEAR